MWTSLINNKLFLFLIFITIGIILADEEKCKSIEHCYKCPEQNKCETCEDGYTLNFEQTKCVLLENNNKNSPSGPSKKSSIVSPQKSPVPPQNSPAPSGSAKKSSPVPQQNSPAPSNSNKKSFPAPPLNQPSALAKTSSNNSIKKASNPPVASNNPQPSALDNITNEETKSFSRTICKMIIYLIIAALLIFGLRWLYLKKKKYKLGYYNDDNRNPDENAKAVYIK